MGLDLLVCKPSSAVHAKAMGAPMKIYGTVRYNEKKKLWLVAAEPHVLIKLCRLFPRTHHAGAGDEDEIFGTYKLSDTLEICRDLEWFLLRYPMLFQPQRLKKKLQLRAAAHIEQQTTVAELLAGIRLPEGVELAVPLREYQRLAVTMWFEMKGLLLADEMGLGKTASAIGGLADTRTLPALVVTLTHLPEQWEVELAKFAPALTTHVLKTGKPYELRQARRGGEPTFPDVIISNYHKLAKWAPVLMPLVKAVVFDEIQELRRGTKSEKGAAAYAIAHHAEYRIGLSGTPIYNYGGEMFNVVQALRPDSLGSYDEYLKEWCQSVDFRGNSRINNPAAFGTYLRDQGIMLRRTRSDVGRELPPLTRTVQHIDSDLEHLNKVETDATELARIILSDNPLGRGDKFRASEELSILLRQATGIAKAPYVAEFVKLIAETESKIVLYGWHREVYELWLEQLKELAPVMFTGSESPKQKRASKKAFCEGDAKVMIISLRAGAGLDGLQERCQTVIFGELDWSPGVHSQCEARIFRDGQKEPVFAYYLVTDSGSDPVVADVLGLKKVQAEGVLNPQRELLEKLETDPNHIKKLAETYLRKVRERSVA